MSNEELRELSTADLKERLAKMELDYKQLKAQHSVSPIDNPSRIQKDRRDIARAKTELRSRELNNK